MTRAPVGSALHSPVEARGARQSRCLDLIDIALADRDVRGRILDMEGLPVNDASATPPDGGITGLLIVLVLKSRWDQYVVANFVVANFANEIE